jgi:hypothetical protein
MTKVTRYSRLMVKQPTSTRWKQPGYMCIVEIPCRLHLTWNWILVVIVYLCKTNVLHLQAVHLRQEKMQSFQYPNQKPISKTVWPTDGSAQWLTNQRSLLGHIQAKTFFWLAAGYWGHSVNKYKCVIDTHIILVRTQNSCIKYSTQNQQY